MNSITAFFAASMAAWDSVETIVKCRETILHTVFVIFLRIGFNGTEQWRIGMEMDGGEGMQR